MQWNIIAFAVFTTKIVSFLKNEIFGENLSWANFEKSMKSKRKSDRN